MEQDFIRGWRREREGGYDQDFGGLNGAWFYPWLVERKGRWIRGKKVTLKWSKILSVVGGAKGKVDTR